MVIVRTLAYDREMDGGELGLPEQPAVALNPQADPLGHAVLDIPAEFGFVFDGDGVLISAPPADWLSCVPYAAPWRARAVLWGFPTVLLVVFASLFYYGSEAAIVTALFGISILPLWYAEQILGVVDRAQLDATGVRGVTLLRRKVDLRWPAVTTAKISKSRTLGRKLEITHTGGSNSLQLGSSLRVDAGAVRAISEIRKARRPITVAMRPPNSTFGRKWMREHPRAALAAGGVLAWITIGFLIGLLSGQMVIVRVALAPFFAVVMVWLVLLVGLWAAEMLGLGKGFASDKPAEELGWIDRRIAGCFGLLVALSIMVGLGFAAWVTVLTVYKVLGLLGA
jgi:hypothetical protein